MNSEKNVPMEQAILEAAERLFLDKGFALTTTTEIAREAGCNQALVHYYFRTKENLFQRIYEQKIRLFASAFLGSGNEAGTFEERLREKIGAHFEVLRRNPKIPFLMFNELITNPSRVEAFRQTVSGMLEQVFEHLSEHLRREAEAGNIRPTDPRDLMLNVISLNIFAFLSLPLIRKMMDIPDDRVDEYLTQRKEEIIATILGRLKP